MGVRGFLNLPDGSNSRGYFLVKPDDPFVVQGSNDEYYSGEIVVNYTSGADVNPNSIFISVHEMDDF